MENPILSPVRHRKMYHVTTALAHSSLTVQDTKNCVKWSFLLYPSFKGF